MGTKFLPGASTRTSKETLRFPNAVSILLDKERSSVDTPFFAPAQEGMKDPPGKGTQPGTEHRHDPADKFMEFSTLNLSAIRDRQELLQVLTQGLKDHFGFDDAAIALINEDQTTVSISTLHPDPEVNLEPASHALVQDHHSLSDGIFNRILASPAPVIFDLDLLTRELQLPGWLQLKYECGARQLAAVRFNQNGLVTGFWLICTNKKFHPDSKTITVFNGLAGQVGLVLSNIIANETIERQSAEIERYKHQLEVQTIDPDNGNGTSNPYTDIIGESPTLKKIFRLVAQVADSDSTVLILGETGTGKELIARAIHNGSPRKNKLMVKINCAALPANLIESELFGHERGSFTGAMDRRIGKFELAHGGTLFLDEIGEMPLDLQVKLLRVLQEKEIERIGGRTTIKVDVRIIAATNRDLQQEMAAGRFRKDLYYRLNIFPISLPPLRERLQDIPLLASHFIQRFAKKNGRCIIGLHTCAIQALMEYEWPGNIRELEHLIERSVLQATGDTIRQICLPLENKDAQLPPAAERFTPKPFDVLEKEFILKTIKYCSGQISGDGGAAQLLGLPPSTLNSKMKRLGIRKEHII